MVSRSLDDSTIVAISTPPGEGGIGVVRLSGKEAIPVAERIFVSKSGKPVRDQKNFTARYGHAVCRDSEEPQVIDEVLLLVMRGPRSYTGEDVVEMSVHGGTAVLQAIVEEALKAGARLAMEGEFTKRAFLNGRMDLLQAEAVLDLIQAKTQLGRRWAAAQLEGTLSKKVQSMKRGLVEVLSDLEASIDFPDDFPDVSSPSEMGRRLESIGGQTQELLSRAEWGELVKRGLKIVISGKPNVGKSSLMNLLSKSNRVIVTPYPGTTRDVVEEETQIGGFPVRLFDTAGMRRTAHPIEKEGVDRSKKALQAADLVLCVLDTSSEWDENDEAVLRDAEEKKKIFILNKLDLPRRLAPKPLSPAVECSCVTEEGIRELENEIFRFVTGGKLEIPDETVISSVRQKDILEKANQSIQNAARACQEGLSPDLIAVDVRLALDHLGGLVGEVVTDEILDALFSRFCIGK